MDIGVSTSQSTCCPTNHLSARACLGPVRRSFRRTLAPRHPSLVCSGPYFEAGYQPGWALSAQNKTQSFQQISTSAAQTIRGRVEQLVRPGAPTPSKMAKLADSQLSSAGLSRQKVSYVRDLVHQSLAGKIRYRNFSRMTDCEITQNLVQVKGIGEWTAQMFLIFSLGRQDVFPHDDLGIRNAIRKLYGLNELPGKATCCRIAAPWRPYSSVASWYCWQSLKIDDILNQSE